MQRDEQHQGARERIVERARREDPEVGRQRAVAGEYDSRQIGLDRRRDAAARHAEDEQIEQPVRPPREPVEQRMARAGRRRMRGARPQQEAGQHQREDHPAPGHVGAQRLDLGRIGVGRRRHHQGAERERRDDEERQEPVHGDERRMIAGDVRHG